MSADPFRDDLAAAHATIDRLEREKLVLEKRIAELQPRHPEPPRKLSPEQERRNTMVSVAVFGAMLVALLFAIWAIVRGLGRA